MKHCGSCDQDKDESEFHKEVKRSDGLASQCKSCRSGHYKKTYPARKDRIKVLTTAHRRLWWERVALLKSGPCTDCGGVFPPYVMDFDHRVGEEKFEGVSSLVGRTATWEVIEAEIAKCDLVCANCHRIRTYTRMGRLDAVPKRLTELPAKQSLAGSSPASVSMTR
jgi:hypothetical protein